MDKSLIDTDIFSEILKAVDSYVVAQATAYRSLFIGNQDHYRRIQNLRHPLKLGNWQQE